MSNASSKPVAAAERVEQGVNWRPRLGVVFVLSVFYLSQLFGGSIVSLYPWLKHWTRDYTATWLTNSVFAQFVFILLAESFIIGALYLFLKYYKRSFKDIGLHRPKWSDLGYGLLAVPVCFALYLVTVGLVSHLVPSLNVNQQQDIGFTSVYGAPQYILTFIALAILPPFTEELMVRGFLYSSLKKGFRVLPAVLITSAIFAAAHLPEGGAAGPLYIGALDTFVLSLVLIYLREKTGSLWSSMLLHCVKNSTAFLYLFILHSR